MKDKTEQNNTLTEQALLKAFNECLEQIKLYKTTKEALSDNYNALCYNALTLYKLFNRAESFYKLLIEQHFFFMREYFESIGLFFIPVKDEHKKKIVFLKVLTDEQGLFKTCESVDNLPTLKDFLQDKKEQNKEKEKDYNKSLSRLFKGKSKQQIKDLFNSFFTALK